jgi:asparagine synthase (glutamine-hydrolysing)
MDSSSVVCIADSILEHGESGTPRLDTLSCYDDSEPNWNERPFFTTVEEKRGRQGCHIDVSSHNSFNFLRAAGSFVASPDAIGSGSRFDAEFSACMKLQGYRVVLSGAGGDEATGGVPTPLPELEDLFARGQVRELAHKLKLWALEKRKPWFHLLFGAIRAFLPLSLIGAPKYARPAVWLDPAFVARNRDALGGYVSRVKLFGPLPTFQENIATLAVLQRQLASEGVPQDPHYEKRYPCADCGVLCVHKGSATRHGDAFRNSSNL